MSDRLIVLMDVDGCVNLIEPGLPIRPGILLLADTLACLGFEIVLWSAGGADHARNEAQRAGIHGSVLRYFDKLDYDDKDPQHVIDLIGSAPVLQIDDDWAERIGTWAFAYWGLADTREGTE